jgi:hypothetical protein
MLSRNVNDVGDQVEATYTEAVALSVEPVTAKK